MRAVARRLAAAAFILLSGAASAQNVPSPQWGLEQLMARLRQVTQASARFHERKYFQIVEQPLDTYGTLSWAAPDRLEKLTLEPKRERFTVDGDRLTVEGTDRKVRTMSLSEIPELRAFIESIRATLSGDLAMLERFYQVSLDGNAADWQLVLRPRESRMRQFVTSIRIFGSNAVVHRVITQEADGDRSEMTITEERR